MKTLKDILEASNHLPSMPIPKVGQEDEKYPHHGRDKAEGEKQFKKKHTDNILDKAYPAKGTDDVLNARSAKKDHSHKQADLSPEEQKIAYEEYKVEDIIEELLDLSEIDDTHIFELDDNSEVEMSPELAEQLVYTIDQLAEENQEKFINILLKDRDGFSAMVKFANEVE